MPKKSVPKAASGAVAEFELSSHLPYLFRHIYAQLEVASAGRLAQFGVNVAVWRILAVLWQRGDLAHRELADLTSIDVSTLSRVSKSVQRDGLIRRKRTDEDQRTVRVTLTDKGRELVQQIIPSARHIQDEIIGDLPASDVQALTRILHVVAKNLSRYTESDFDLIEPGTAAEARKTEETPKPVKQPTNGAAKRAPAKQAPAKRASKALAA